MNWKMVAGASALSAAAAFGSSVWVAAQQGQAGVVAIDPDDIGGRVASSKGPEAGVWVIAETTDLPTKFTRIVVTDDQGRYSRFRIFQGNLPVFARGYGLVDSARQSAKPGQQLDVAVSVAPDAKTAAIVYPAAYWLSMLQPPAGAAGRDFPMNIKTCFDCHQLGNKATREILPSMRAGTTSTLDAWHRRTAVGPSGPAMAGSFKAFGEHCRCLRRLDRSNRQRRVAQGGRTAASGRGRAEPGDLDVGLGLAD